MPLAHALSKNLTWGGVLNSYDYSAFRQSCDNPNLDSLVQIVFVNFAEELH